MLSNAQQCSNFEKTLLFGETTEAVGAGDKNFASERFLELPPGYARQLKITIENLLSSTFNKAILIYHKIMLEFLRKIPATET